LASTFSPTTLSVPAGTTVTWKNDTGVPHNVLWNDAAGRSAAGAGDGTGDIADASATHTRKFVTAGTYGFHCSIHAPGMTGTLTVNP
jgi:plastocyanin